MSITEQSGHLAWCALTALALARHEKGISSPAQENLFLVRWFSTALKQHRFSRSLKSDIEWMLYEGRQFGAQCHLSDKLNYIWQCASNGHFDDNDLLRLTYLIEAVENQHWKCFILTDGLWLHRLGKELDSSINTLYLSKSNTNAAFNDDGQLIAPLIAQLSGNVADLISIMAQYGWYAEKDPANSHQHLLKAR